MTARRALAGVVIGTLLLSACATPVPRSVAAGETASACLTLFQAVDEAVAEAGVGDAEAAHLEAFPYLRVDRLLSALRHDLQGPAARRFWLERLGELDASGRAAELANLPASTTNRIAIQHALVPGTDALARALDSCRSALIEADLADGARFAHLVAAATVPDRYSLARRMLGLYPLTRLPFVLGVRRFERTTQERFSVAEDALPRRGTLQRYDPALLAPSSSPAGVSDLLAAASNNPLRLPHPDPEGLARLAHHYAPRLEIDTTDRYDRFGHPVWPAHGPAGIDTDTPVLFYRGAATLFGDRILFQLVYTGWFPERPRSGPLDLLGGHLDALVWRVTVLPDGTPLVFDSIHGCGCYHFFFPTPLVRARPPPHALEEWLFVPQTLPALDADARLRLRVASATHYLERVGVVDEDRRPASLRRYALLPEALLRSLPHPSNGRRSLFGPDGMVAGTERRERFLFWPMGILDPGAMRQWGHHATAFVGRRHFDDARLFDLRFEALR